LSALRAGRPLPPRKIHGTHFCHRLSRPQGHSAAGRIRSIGKIHLIATRNRDLPACSIVPQPTTLPFLFNIYQQDYDAIIHFRNGCHLSFKKIGPANVEFYPCIRTCNPLLHEKLAACKTRHSETVAVSRGNKRIRSYVLIQVFNCFLYIRIHNSAIFLSSYVTISPLENPTLR
jgi:hypothetical protein